MLLKLLSEEQKKTLVVFAELLSVADKPVLWDGKTKEEITSRTNMDNLSFQKGEAELALLQEWREEAGIKESDFQQRMHSLFDGKTIKTRDQIERDLLGILKDIPLRESTEAPEVRSPAVSLILQDLLKEKSIEGTQAAKAILFELMLLALVSGNISGVEYRFLGEFALHHNIDDITFQEILERAEAFCRERRKTISLILE